MSSPVVRPAARHRPAARTLVVLATGLALLAVWAPAAAVRAADPTASASPAHVQPTIQYEEAMAHAADKIAFAPGDRVSIGFKPRHSDRWNVGGARSQALPAGRLTGNDLRRQGSAPVPATTTIAPSGSVGSVDTPVFDPSAAIPADLAAAVDPGGLKREVFGFLPYWELNASSTRLDWAKLSTIAYFGVGAASNGDLQRRNSDGSTTVGWSGWTSSKMTSIINAAHASGARVVLTVQSFAWSTTGAKNQMTLLGSSANRANLARQIAAAVRDRGADGANLDFEPIASTYADEFTALVKSVRNELDKVHAGYQLTFDATGWIGNYPIEDSTGSNAADAVVIMGYDYRSASSATVGSIAPIGGPTYDVGDTLQAYLARIPASRIILGVPYYGRAWSTKTADLNSKNISGTKNGASASVVYTTARKYAADHGQSWDPVEGVAWTVYRRQNCTATYGCVNPWRQLYFDSSKALRLKYDLVNKDNLRGVGIWALGYDGTRPELYQALGDKFITDTVPPVITSSSISTTLVSPNGDGRLDTTTINVKVTGQLTFGWVVEPYFDSIAGPKVVSGSSSSKTVSYTWDGKTGAGAAVPDGPYRITVWTADASDNRASVAKVVTIDTHAASVRMSSSHLSISPDGDGHTDRMALAMSASEAVTGKARILDQAGKVVRGWAIKKSATGRWVWNGDDARGRRVPDGRYTFRINGLDAAGNRTVKDLAVRVDRTIRSVRWSAASFRPRVGQRDTVTFSLLRKATVTVAIYQGSRLVRTIRSGQAMTAGVHSWTWNGKAAHAYVAAGTYKIVIDATSRIGASRFARSVVVKVP